ncbi:sulfur carrier protein ThiS [Roseovarius litorisediminis]|uniref:Sulfur carrier protein ThiS n=1 Tax=Roseovarius litorisediminis TaxID=1312363 RepID=A0A1Y5SRI1_9RHOB|nr:sulfur carrier protein ThiS [Roseovarius litorisediminis]SLN45335.1 sulfur carrier protein ThiS [Roseovarius litorisediminis]
MKIVVNGDPTEFDGTTLTDLLKVLGHGTAKVATAVNEAFVAAAARDTHTLEPGDRVEIVAPRQGG